MTTTPFSVGIIGASADRGWAKISHVPAVQRLPGLELGAVVAGSQQKSDAAAQAFGAKAAYATAQELFQDPRIAIVSIAVKVPDHRDLVLGALAARKHIYCEWPLGRDLAETVELAEAARSAGVHVAIGLQTRSNPAARRARALIASGAIGRILSARVLSTTVAFGPQVEDAMAFGEDPANGVTLVTVQGAHTLDFAISVLGPFDGVNALATTQFPEIEVGEQAVRQPRRTPDHLLTQSRFAEGAALSIEVAGGLPPEAVTFRLEVTGATGALALHGGAIRGFQSGRLSLSLNGKPEHVEEGELASLPDTAVNVAGMYAGLRDDITSGNFTVPDFQHAVLLARLIASVAASAQTGTRQSADDWPTS